MSAAAPVVDNLDTKILTALTDTENGWGGLVKLQKRGAKELVLKEDGATLPSPHVLQFLGSFRKIVVEYFVTKFLSQKPEIVPQFIHVAFGSTNITSDYDVSFIGPGVADLIQEIIGEFTTLYGKSFPFLMDSNLYGAPMFVAPREGGWGAPDWLKTLDITSSVVSGAKSGALSTSGSFDAGKQGVFLPVPASDVAFAVEWVGAETHLGGGEHHLSDEELVAKQGRLGGVIRELDRIQYGGGGFSGVDEKAYFELVQRALVESVEAYHTLSSVLIVVYGLQAGMDLGGMGILDRRMKLLSAYENLLMFLNGVAGEGVDDSTQLSYSKYLQRVFASLEIGGWEEDVPEDLREMLGQMERVVSLRGKLVGDMTDAEKADFDAYMEFVKGAGISELRGFLEGRKGEFIAEPAPADSTGTGGRRHRKRRTVRRRHRVARRTQTKNKKSH